MNFVLAPSLLSIFLIYCDKHGMNSYNSVFIQTTCQYKSIIYYGKSADGKRLIGIMA